MILTGASGFLIAYGFSYTSSAEAAKLTENSRQLRLSIMNFSNLVNFLFISLLQILIGYLIEKSKHRFS